jgi:Transglycosylase-like domain
LAASAPSFAGSALAEQPAASGGTASSDTPANTTRAKRTPERNRALRYRRKVRRIPRWGKSQLRGIAWCESRNNPRAIGGGGAYRGLYQFSFGTWYAVGGEGDPVAAPRSEQTWRAWRLLKSHGSAHWPVCG